jgi:hypothetical protein
MTAEGPSQSSFALPLGRNPTWEASPVVEITQKLFLSSDPACFKSSTTLGIRVHAGRKRNRRHNVSRHDEGQD